VFQPKECGQRGKREDAEHRQRSDSPEDATQQRSLRQHLRRTLLFKELRVKPPAERLTAGATMAVGSLRPPALDVRDASATSYRRRRIIEIGLALPAEPPGSIREAFISGTQPGANTFNRQP
jgi:hypothetical protein